MAVRGFSRKYSATRVDDLDLQKVLEDQLALKLSRIDMTVIFMNGKGIGMKLSVDDVKHILKQKFMSEFPIYAIK